MKQHFFGYSTRRRHRERKSNLQFEVKIKKLLMTVVRQHLQGGYYICKKPALNCTKLCFV